MSDTKRFREATWWAWPPSASRPPPPRTRPNNQYPRYYELGLAFKNTTPPLIVKRRRKKEHIFYFSARRYHHKGFARWYWFLCQKNLYFWQVIISQIFVFVFCQQLYETRVRDIVMFSFATMAFLSYCILSRSSLLSSSTFLRRSTTRRGWVHVCKRDRGRKVKLERETERRERVCRTASCLDHQIIILNSRPSYSHLERAKLYQRSEKWKTATDKAYTLVFVFHFVLDLLLVVLHRVLQFISFSLYVLPEMKFRSY